MQLDDYIHSTIVNESSDTSPSIYRYINSGFERQHTNYSIKRDNLYLQEEMHDASVVFFFVWDIYNIKNEYPKRFYREITMISGFLGHQLSLKSVSQGYRGTNFAGISPIEFSALLQKDSSRYLPIFAYAME